MAGRGAWERIQAAVLKPPDPAGVARAPAGRPDAASPTLTDKERAVGLVAAPLAALIGFVAAGNLDPANVGTSLRAELLLALLSLAVAMLAAALLRKRTVLGIVAALYGLAAFNLHYWGFGAPFVMVGAWLLVLAYRAQRQLRDGDAGAPVGATARPGGSAGRTATSCHRDKPDK